MAERGRGTGRNWRAQGWDDAKVDARRGSWRREVGATWSRARRRWATGGCGVKIWIWCIKRKKCSLTAARQWVCWETEQRASGAMGAMEQTRAGGDGGGGVGSDGVCGVCAGCVGCVGCVGKDVARKRALLDFKKMNKFL